jgi:dTDP-L-rhamnose 4-epimerase
MTIEQSAMETVRPGALVLVTGGAGFIGSHTVDLLLEKGYRVRVLDSLQPRVHPRGKPPWVPAAADFRKGDVSSPADLSAALEDVEAVLHLAAYQDYMTDFSTFVHVNTESTALLFELIVSDQKRFPVRKMVFASSQSVSGEGRYMCTGEAVPGDALAALVSREQEAELKRGGGCGVLRPAPRSLEQLRAGDWEVHCPAAAGPCGPC